MKLINIILVNLNNQIILKKWKKQINNFKL